MERVAEHAAVSIAFPVTAEWLPDSGEWRPIEPARIKDYDALEGAAPAAWAERFDVTHWRILAAYRGETRIGGAVLAFRTPGCTMLAGREDLALLWDLRVTPAHRRTGVGRALVAAAREWAGGRGCRALRIETQTINAAACRLYHEAGGRLIAVVPGAYAACPDEVQVVWELDCG